MKKLISFAALCALTLSLVACGNTETTTTSTADLTTEDILVQPDRKMDIYGKILSQEGNEYTIQVVDITADPTFGMEQEEKKAYMAALSEDERMALKDETRNAILGEEKVIIPVGIPIEVKTAQGQDAEIKLGSLEDLTIGSYVSVRFNPNITDQKIAEYLKKNFSN